MDLSQFSTDDLKAMQAGDLSKVSTAGLKALHGMSQAQEAPPNPATGGSTLQVFNPFGKNLDTGINIGETTTQALAGVGSGMSRTARAVGQAVGLVDQKQIDEANKLDAPLVATKAGSRGQMLGQALVAAPAMFIPGAGTYAGAAAIGAGTGALTTEGGIADRAIGASAGALGGLAGKVAGDTIGEGAKWLSNKLAMTRAAAQTANASRDAALSGAQQAGYVTPPVDTNPTWLNELTGGLSGKIKTSQAASVKNQSVTNSLAAKALGLPDDEPITQAALQTVRRNAGQAYDAVSSAGVVTPGQPYSDALDKIVAPYVKASQSFPSAKPNPIIQEIDSLRTGQFDAGSAVAKIKTLRVDADGAYASGDKGLGKALKDGALALEDAIDQHLQTIGAPSDTLGNFRDARQLIAKTYTVEKALNPTTGDVSAPVLGKALARGRPLSGELKDIAMANQLAPKATQALTQSTGSVSPLDFAVAAMRGDPAALLTLGARPAVRSAILSSALNSKLAAPSYDGNALANLLLGGAQSSQLNRLAPIMGNQLALRSRATD